MNARTILLPLLLCAGLLTAQSECTDDTGDVDLDGWTVEDGDCDDANPTINPGAEEVCDGIDQNCNDLVDDGLGTDIYYLDQDGDGYGGDTFIEYCEAPVGYTPIAGDCDEDNPAAFPGAQETCDGVDEDCDGVIDNDLDTFVYYTDEDGDGVGAGEPIESCLTLSGLVTDGTDCDDSNPDISPIAFESCQDGLDNDCDGLEDASDSDCECPAEDLDSYIGDSAASGTIEEGAPSTYVPTQCGAAADSPDATFAWTAPMEGTYQFDTAGSDIDTILTALSENCEGEVLACNDDADGASSSKVQLTLNGGERIVLVVSNYYVDGNVATGDYVLNISEVSER